MERYQYPYVEKTCGYCKVPTQTGRYPARYQHGWRLPHWAYLMPSPLTGQRYTMFLSDTLPLLLDDVPLGVRRRMWFQHDGAPVHNAVNARRHLNEVFETDG